MRAVIVLVGGIIGAVAGWFIAAAATIAFGGYFGLTEFEGQRSMTAVFGIGPVGGLIGLVVGIWLALRWTRR